MSDEPELVLDGELVEDWDTRGPVLDGQLVVDSATSGREAIAGYLVDGWLARCKTDNTREAYRRDIGFYLDYVADRIETWLDARGEDIVDYKAWLDATTVRGRPLATATIARRLSVVSTLYRWAIRREVLLRNPVDYIDRPELDPDHSDTSALTEDEARRVIAAAFRLVGTAGGADVRRVADRDSVMVAVLLVTGLRCAEICGARIERLGYDRGQRILGVTRKGRKAGRIPLGAAAELVDRHLGVRTEGPLFVTRSGKPVTRQWLFRAVRRVAAAAAVPQPERITPHSLRHTFATLSLDRGSTLDDLQIALGHADPRTTRRYDRNRARLDRSPVHLLGPALLRGNDDRTDRLF